tara:strand:- start:825 stop:1478 length:654 start_codon:yes stop_codon:yes gene_type:complete
MNNAVRVAYQALSAVFGGTQSLHTNSYDEALGLPTEDSAKLALRTQQIIAEELGITDFVDPLGGSSAIEGITDDLIKEARSIIHDIRNLGGAMECVKAGFQQRMIHESAWDHLRRVEGKNELVVGVNSHIDESEPDFEGLILDSDEADTQISRLIEMKGSRDSETVKESLSVLRRCCRDGSNIMPPIISAVKAEATVGEVNSVLREEFGTWVAPSGV